MLRNFNSSAIVAVSDIRRSKDFYANTLGLELEDGYDGLLKFNTGHTSLVVYESEYAGTNKANAVVWGVGDEIEQIVKMLKNKGVSFEHYSLGEGAEVHGDIHVQGPMKMVWFKDPDGNLLHLNNM